MKQQEIEEKIEEKSIGFYNWVYAHTYGSFDRFYFFFSEKYFTKTIEELYQIYIKSINKQ